MRAPFAIALLAVSAHVAAADSAPSKPAPEAKPAVCREAIVNPVSRYAECVDPPGAPVAQVPDTAAPPCPPVPPHSAGFGIRSRCIPDKNAPTADQPAP